MVGENNLQMFEEMFNLSSKEDGEEQAEEYGYSNNSTEPFTKLESAIGEDIKELKDKGAILEVENVYDIIKDVASRPHSKEQEITDEHVEISMPVETKEEEVIDVMIDSNDFDYLPAQDVKEDVSEVKEDVSEVEEEVFEVKEEKTECSKDFTKDNASSLDEVGVEESSMLDGDKVMWSFKSSSAMYDQFYAQKKKVVESCIVGGQVEFSLWDKELQDAQVDVITEVFDQQVIINQMEAVQQFRNRVKYIGVRVNNQYFLFDRFTPLLRGYLARVQHLKPILKQEGLILEHMADVEMYLERLRGLRKSVADTERNLAAAYEMLSRKVTICMELPPVERYQKQDTDSYRSKFADAESFTDVPSTCNMVSDKLSKEMNDFDDLPEGAKAGQVDQETGVVSWGKL